MVCSARFAGDRHTGLGAPAFARPGRASSSARLRRSLAACGGGVVLGRERAGRAPTGSRSSTAAVPDRAAPRPDLAAAARRPQHGRQDDPGADGDGLDRRQGGPDLLAALRHPRPAARPGPARPPGLGARRRTTRSSPAPRSPAAPQTSNRKTFDFGPLKPGETIECGLEAERGEDRPLHAPLRDRRRPQRHGEGGDRRRRRAGRLLRGADLQRAARTRSSPTTARSSKSPRGDGRSK